MSDTTPENPKMSWWRRLSSGLKRTSNSLGTAVADLVTKRKLDRAMLEDIEDVLLRADLGTGVAAVSSGEPDQSTRAVVADGGDGALELVVDDYSGTAAHDR